MDTTRIIEMLCSDNFDDVRLAIELINLHNLKIKYLEISDKWWQPMINQLKYGSKVLDDEFMVHHKILRLVVKVTY